MNKHNIIELCDYRKNKNKVKQEHLCFEFLDSLKERIRMSKTYAASFKQYLECMVRDGHVKQRFTDNLKQQVDLMMTTAYEEFSRKEAK
jgi:hypothetical protein